MRALILGRFQPPHHGHLRALLRAARRYQSVFVGIGSSQESHTRDNPFTAGERVELLQAALSRHRLRNVFLFPIPDIHRHSAWVAHVEALVPPFDLVITHNPLTRRLFRAQGYRIEPGPEWRRAEWSGREVRRRARAKLPLRPLVPPEVLRALRRMSGLERLAATGGPARGR